MTGADLSRLLGYLGLTQEAAAEKLGKSRATIIRWCGSASLSPEIALLIRSKLGELPLQQNVETPTKKDTAEQDPFWPIAENTARIIAIAKQFQDELKEVKHTVTEHTYQIEGIVRTIGELNKVDGQLEKELKELRELIQAL